MAFLDTTHLDRKPTSPIAFEALMAQLDVKRLDIARQRPRDEAAVPTAELHRVQQMLLAGAGAAVLIVAVAGTMMLNLL